MYICIIREHQQMCALVGFFGVRICWLCFHLICLCMHDVIVALTAGSFRSNLETGSVLKMRVFQGEENVGGR